MFVSAETCSDGRAANRASNGSFGAKNGKSGAARARIGELESVFRRRVFWGKVLGFGQPHAVEPVPIGDYERAIRNVRNPEEKRFSDGKDLIAK